MTAACSACIVDMTATPEIAQSNRNVVLSVPKLHCAGCIRSVEDILNAVPGVREARVNLSLRRAIVSTDLPPEVLIDALAKKAGFEAFVLDQAALGPQADPAGQDLILRLGVAGFAMMNVMLLSVAVWSGASDATRDLFHLISAGIALPATIYAARPFFESAGKALGKGRLNMDVPISLAILLACGMSLYESLEGGAQTYFDAALSLTFFLLIGRVLEHRTRAVAQSAARELAALEVHKAQRKRGRQVEEVSASELSIGDVVIVPTGMRVPVDGPLTSSAAFTDRSFLTGESDPVSNIGGDLLQAGEINLGAPFEMRAAAVGDATNLRQIARMVETAENARNRYTSLADRAAQIYAPAVHGLAAAAFLGWFAATGDVRLALNIAIAVLIITCPCALGLAVPAVSTAAIARLYQMGFLVKSGTALERLAEVKSVVLDKTGTLTRPGFRFKLDGLVPGDLSIAKGLAQGSAHPVARALLQHLGDIDAAEICDIREVPGQGVTGIVHDRPVKLGQAGWITGHGQTGLALQVGDRVLSLKQSETVRPGVRAMVDGLRRQGLKLRVLSGDTPDQTEALAKDLCIADWSASQSPVDKHERVTGLAVQGELACMVGDGINDAAALTAAHASIAPSTGLDAARSTADVVLIRQSLEDVPKLISVSRKAARLSRQNFAIAAAYNLVAIPLALAGLATPLLAALAMSTSSITVMLNALRVRWRTE